MGPPIPDSNAAGRLTRLGALLVLAFATVAALAPVLGFGFTSWDDFETVARNPRLNPPSAAALADFWTHPQMDLYIPVTYTLWAGLADAARLERPVNGSMLDPLPFHAMNLALHLAASIVVLLVLFDLFHSHLAALIGALLFALHPVQVESVAWVSGMKDLLFALLSLVAIWQYLRLARRDISAQPIAASAWWGGYLLATIAFILAMLSKPAAMILPGVVIVLDWLVIGRPLRRIRRTIWPWILLAIPCAVFTAMFQRAPGSAAAAPAIWLRPLVAADAMAFYIFKLIFPISLGIDYGRNPARVIAHGWLYYTWLVPFVVMLAAILYWKRTRIVAAGALTMLIVLLPVLGFVPFDFQTYSTVADHYLYLAMLGPALVAAWAVARWPGRNIIAPAGVLLVLLGARTFAQTWNWRDSTHLFHHALTVNPQSFAAYDSLAAAAIERQDWTSAIALGRRAIQYNPDFAASYLPLAQALGRTGDARGAEQAYRKALSLHPNYPAALSNLSSMLAAEGRLDEAIPLARNAARLQPRSIEAHLNLGKMYYQSDQIAPAREQFQTVLRLDPGNRGARELLARIRLESHSKPVPRDGAAPATSP
jgi:Tfp pilus assembly protein PilF